MVGKGEAALLIPAQDAWNAEVFADIIERPARERSKELAACREAYSRKLLERRLPRFLHGLLDHPRALKLMLRLVPRWRPTMTFVRLHEQQGSQAPMTAACAVDASELWLQEREAKGLDVSGGHVFEYIDPQGLPSEVYGP